MIISVNNGLVLVYILGITIADNGTYRCELRSVHGLISHVTYNVEVIGESSALHTNIR